MNALRSFVTLVLIAAFYCNKAQAQERGEGNLVYVQITEQYQYPNTELVSLPGMIEEVIAEDERYFTLSTPIGTTVKIPKVLAKKVSLEVAINGLIAERAMTNKAMQNVAAYIGRLEAENKRLGAGRPQMNNPAKVELNQQPNLPQAPNPLSVLEGSRLIADDGTFLGTISRNRVAESSIANKVGIHGSKFAAESIFNQFGLYGGKFSAMSPYNKFSATPPKIVLNNGKWIYLTINKFQTPRLDPGDVVSWMLTE